MIIWMRGEPRPNEARAPMTPAGAAKLMKAGLQVMVEDSPSRAIATSEYAAVGCQIVPDQSWQTAPHDAVILGLKELPNDATPLQHRHIMFGHAFKGQPSGPALLNRFKAGGGALLDLEYLVDDTGRRVAAFGYWAGFAGAALSAMAWGAGRSGDVLGAVTAFTSADAMVAETQAALPKDTAMALVIGALGRVGTGAADLCRAIGIEPTLWDQEETADGGPFPEVLAHDILLNCILARPGTPVFVPTSAKTSERRLSVIGDIACDPESEYSPIKVYDQVSTWDKPVWRMQDDPVLDVMAIDNLPSLLPAESTEDFADQLLPHLINIETDPDGVWRRAKSTYLSHIV